MQIKSMAVSVKAGPEDGLEEGEFLVYPSTFTREPDAYGDIVAKGAFLDSISEWLKSGNILPGLYGHRMDDPDYFVAGASAMGEDDHGWWVKGLFDLDSPKGPQVYRLVKGRRLSQLSFAYDTLEEGVVELEDGRKANELRKLKLYEFSFVPVGANQDTSVVAVKALADATVGAVKAGRVLSAKTVETVKTAISALQSLLDAEPNDDSKASVRPVVKDEELEKVKDEEPEKAKSEEPAPVKSEEPPTVASVDTKSAEIKNYSRATAWKELL